MDNDKYILHGLDLPVLLESYWQKKPCVIRQFIPDFVDPLDEHDLAGLAQEPEVDSRVISYEAQRTDRQWQVTQGPIDDFEPLCKGAWTLLVQGVERYVSEVDALTDSVSQLGHWRMDDVMVSFSSPNAGVGPHIDQYDVFIVQGKGTRRWQIGLPSQYEQISPHPLIRQISGFEPVIDEILQAGDAVYIPPQHPHDGVAMSNCLNYSIGFRAPTDLELLNGVIDEGEVMQDAQTRYLAPDILDYRDSNVLPAEITKKELHRLHANMLALLKSPESEHALLQFISRQSLPDMSPQEPFEYLDVLALVQQGVEFAMCSGVKAIYAQSEQTDFIFFIDGQSFSADIALKLPLTRLLNKRPMELVESLGKQQQNSLASVMLKLLNHGYIEYILP